MSDVDIRTKLVLDDQASAALNHIKDGFKQTELASQGAQHGAGIFAQTLSTFVAMNFMPAIHSVAEFGRSFLDAAAHGQAADHAVAALMMTAQGTQWNEALRNAEDLGDKLDEIAINAGVSGDSVERAFQTMLTITGASAAGVENATNQLGKMSTVAGVLGMDVEMIAQTFSLLGEGMLPKMKNPLVQLLQTTGIFGDNIKKAGEAWAKMTDEGRQKALNYALDEVTGKLGKAEPSFKQMVQSLENAWDVAKEKLGEPLLAVLVPELKKLVEWIKRSRDQVEDFAKAMSKDVGKYVQEAADAVREGFKWIKEHQTEIKNEIVDAWKFAKGVVDFILAHKTELAILYGVKTAAPAVGAAVDVGKGVVGAAQAGIPALGIAGGAAGAGGAAAALGAFTLAVAGVGLAAWQAKKLIDEGGLKSEDAKNAESVAAMFKGMREDQNMMLRQWTAQEVASFNERRAAMIRYGEAAGMNTRQLGELADATWNAHRVAQQNVEQFDRMNEVMQRLRDSGANMAQLDLGPSVEKLSTGFTAAIGTHDQATAVYIANVLVKNKELAAAFMNSTSLTGDAMDALAEMIKGKSAELDALAGQLKAASDKDKKAEDKGKPTPPKMSIGTANFKIQQDFRDQDPDRVAVVFEQDVGRAVENRLQATTTSPFGT